MFVDQDREALQNDDRSRFSCCIFSAFVEGASVSNKSCDPPRTYLTLVARAGAVLGLLQSCGLIRSFYMALSLSACFTIAFIQLGRRFASNLNTSLYASHSEFSRFKLLLRSHTSLCGRLSIWRSYSMQSASFSSSCCVTCWRRSICLVGVDPSAWVQEPDRRTWRRG